MDKIKLVFFDIDGTLIPFGKNEISESTKRSLKQLRDNGVKIFVATGKSLAQLNATKVVEVQFDGYITLNGQLCYDQDFQLFFANPIDPGEMEVLEKIFDAKKIPFSLVGEFSRYINYINEIVVDRQTATNSAVPNIDRYKGEKIYQITAYVSNRERELLESTLDLCKITSWAPDAVDIIAKDGGKMNAITKIMELNDAKVSETMAFGDAENDLMMVSNAGIGVAMGNATDKLKEVANYITANVEDDGIEKALKHFELI